MLGKGRTHGSLLGHFILVLSLSVPDRCGTLLYVFLFFVPFFILHLFPEICTLYYMKGIFKFIFCNKLDIQGLSQKIMDFCYKTRFSFRNSMKFL